MPDPVFNRHNIAIARFRSDHEKVFQPVILSVWVKSNDGALDHFNLAKNSETGQNYFVNKLKQNLIRHLSKKRLTTQHDGTSYPDLLLMLKLYDWVQFKGK